MDDTPSVPNARPGDAAPTVIATLGVYGSASTWVFNILRELAIARYGAARVHALFSDQVQRVLTDPEVRGRHLVWKLHQADDAWQSFAVLTRARVVLTVRDPRDAVVSMMQRFATSADLAAAAIQNALARVVAAAQGPHLGLRYESSFFRKPETIAALARFLDFPLTATEQRRLFDTYATERVRAFGATLDTLPPERLARVGENGRFDTVTQIHAAHIGDGRIGKWRDVLDPVQQGLLNQRFAPYLRAFGYDT